MITTRTRILSILATVAMLVSMLACFVIPASAADDFKAPYTALLEDVPGATSLAAVIGTAADETTLSNALQEDVTASRITWPTWEYGKEDYPRYAHKAAYDAADYEGKNWSISEPQDWLAMVADSNAATPATFEGVTFYVTKNIDFEGYASESNPMAPLNNSSTNNASTAPFKGIIEGKGHAFQNVYVSLSATSGTQTAGLIDELGAGAVINDFGVEGGTIKGTNSGGHMWVGTFGDPYTPSGVADEDLPQLNRVWSSATIISEAPSNRNAGASGMVGNTAGAGSRIVINGAYFCGDLQGTRELGIFYYLNSDKVYNVLSNPKNGAEGMYSISSANSWTAINNFGVNHDLYDGFDAAADTNNNGKVTSPEEGAWEINKAQSAADGIAPVFFTKTANGDIRFGDATNKIVKVNVADVTDPLYVNLDTEELTKAKLIELTGNDAIAGYSLDGGETPVTFDENNTYVDLDVDSNNEATITFTFTAAGELNEAIEKYTNLSAYSQYLTEEAVTAIDTFLNDEELSADNLATKEETLVGKLKTYATYEETDTDGKNIPGYSLKSTLGDYNNHDGKQVWAINEPKDWIDMVNDSNAETDPATFEGVTFYVTKNIDFESYASESNPMAPLNNNGTNNASTAPFKGIIEGKGHAFQNVYVSLSATSGTQTAGLIDELGAGAVINDFGVEGGTIKGTNSGGHMWVGTFGDPITPSGVADEDVPQLNRVWSSATIISEAASGKNAGASGMVGNTANGTSRIVINGAYFCGDLQGTRELGIFYYLHSDKVYNVLSNPKNGAEGMYGISSANSWTAINNFGVNHDLYDGFDAVADTNNNGNVTSPEEGAWEINKAQLAADGIADVYFTLKDGNIRFGNINNRIVKVTVNTDEKEIYVNNGETLNKAYFADLYDGVSAEAIVIEGDAELASVTAEDGLNVAITIDHAALLANARNKYDKLEAMYLTADAAEKLETFLTSEDDPQAVLDTEDALIEALTGGVFTDYANQGEKKVPGYKDVELYGAYNTAKVWTINEPQDWIDMVRDSVSNDFKDYVFHVTDNIDFEKQPMLPLNYGDKALEDEAPYPFNGTIEGNGHAFKNINVEVTVNNSGKDSVTGMIGKLGQFAVINNFGVDSGSIQVDGTVKELYVATFGEAVHKENGTDKQNAYVDQHAQLNNVWSGADIIVNSTSATTQVASGLLAHSLYSSVSINGGYFFGTLSPASGSFGITSHTRKTTVYNVLSNSATAAEMFTSHSGTTAANNVYATGSTTIDATTFAITNYGKVDPVEKAAWTINGKQTDGQGFDKVYFTITGKDAEGNNIIHPTSIETNKIVRYSIVANGEDAAPIYANAGAAVDVTALLPAGAVIVEVTNTDGAIDAEEGKYPITGDVTVSYTIGADEEEINNLKAQLADKIAEIEALQANDKFDAKYFKAPGDGQIGMDAWLDLAKSEEKADLEAAVAHMNGGTLLIEINDAPATFDKTTYSNSIPAFKDHDVYGKYQPADGANWLIVAPADWYAMDTFANSQDEAGDYFANTTFHLIDDVDFDGEETMLPLGIQTDKKMTFAGTIDGHGFGFENVDIYASAGSDGFVGTAFQPNSSDKVQESIGLIGYLGNCTIQNFGVSSGEIELYSCNAGASTSTFGYITADTTVNFIKVWSGVTLAGSTNPYITPLAGIDRTSTTSAVNVNGFTFYGNISKSGTGVNIVYGVFGGYDSAPATTSTYANIITYPSVKQDGINTYLFGVAADDAFGEYSISNVYGLKKAEGKSAGIGFDFDYRYEFAKNYGGNDATPSWLGTMTMLEAAHDLNSKNAGVYIKLAADGGIRPTGTATDKIVKVEATIGEETKTIYINANQAYTGEALRDALGYGVDTTITNVEVTSGNGEYAGNALTVTGDATIVVSTDVCEHTNGAYVHNDGKNNHTFTCSDCPYEKTTSCKRDWTYDQAISEDGASRHTAQCPDCKHDYVESCQGVKVHSEDCMEDDHWAFDCEIHPDTVVAEGTAEKAHDFENGVWKEDEVDEDKSYIQCTHDGCLAKEYKIHGTANAAGISLAPKANGNIVIDLPENLATAELTFAIEGAYTITHVNGDEWNGGVYAVSNAADVTVTIAADITAVGGTFIVSVANAADAEDTIIDIPGATAIIGFDGVLGDANGDGDVNLADALKTLYAYVGKDGASVDKDINKANADLADPSDEYIIDVKDVYKIVEKWLETILNEE